MKLGELIRPDLVFDDLAASTKEEALSELAQLISAHLNGVAPEEIATVLKDRERLGSTGTEEGVAIPHGKLKKLPATMIAFARCRDGIDFDSRDKEPARIIAVLLAPEREATTHLKLLARLARLLNSKALRDEIVSANNASDIHRVLADADARIE